MESLSIESSSGEFGNHSITQSPNHSMTLTPDMRLLLRLLLLTLLALPSSAAMWKHHYAEVNGIKLHYVSKGGGKLMLFLHGFPEFWYAWKDQLQEFGKDHRAVALDMRGYNLSAKPESVEQYAMPFLVDDVKALADQLLPRRGRKKLVLVGHDWGGVVAWVFAMAHPEYVEKLVIINAPHPGVFGREISSNPEQQKASSYMLLFRSEQAETVLSANQYATLARTVFEGSARPEAFTEEDRRAYLEAWNQPGALTGGLNYYRAARVGPPTGPVQSTGGFSPVLRAGSSPGAGGQGPGAGANLPSQTVPVPTLVIWGEKDRALLTGNLEGLDKFVPDLRIQRIPEGTHWIIHEYPALVNRSIREFLRGR